MKVLQKTTLKNLQILYLQLRHSQDLSTSVRAETQKSQLEKSTKIQYSKDGAPLSARLFLF